MLKKIYYLSTCSTCQRILSLLGNGRDFELQDIKNQPIAVDQLDEMARLAGSYEALFSRRALKFRAWGLYEKELQEEDFRQLILQEYTFLSRPVILIGDQIFIGSGKNNVELAIRKWVSTQA